MSTAATQDRIVRMCDLCGGVDDHPRHMFDHTATGDGVTDASVMSIALDNAPDPIAREGVLNHFRDNSTTLRHMDCCREAGCPDGSCDYVTKGATDKKGAALIKHITTTKPDYAAHLAQQNEK